MQNIEPIIRAYLAVVETGSLTLAAKTIGKTVAAVSYQISRLETALGQQLFIRNGRGMSLSEDGQEFLLQAQLLINTFDQIIHNNKAKNSDIKDELASRTNLIKKRSVDGVSMRRIGVFEDNLETPLFKNLFSFWKSYHADGHEISLDDLIKRGIVSFKDNIFLTQFEQSHIRVAAASEGPVRLFGLDKYGFGITTDELWQSPKISESRNRIFSICQKTNLPVFFSGNAVIPWHSDCYASTIDQFSSSRLDRLLLPVKIQSETGTSTGVLQIAEFRGRLNQLLGKVKGQSLEERAASLSFIGNISIAA